MVIIANIICLIGGTCNILATQGKNKKQIISIERIGSLFTMIGIGIQKSWSDVIGKIIKMRSPIFCKSKQYLCNHCIGNRSYILGIKNLGLTGNIPLDSQKLKSMKSVHDVSIHTVSVDLNTYITEDF
jgi:hypothetical protein